MMGPMSWGQGMEWMGWGMWLGPILLTALWLALIGGIAWIAVALGRRDGTTGAPPALRILEERLARGEIDVTEYSERKAAIGQTS